ncbi:MAG: L-threonylcarbamoyladenylate synthase [Elainellaceae cyanobacterium]
MPPVPFVQLITGAQSGKLISFPTDTVPALAVRPDCANLIFEAKQRSQTKPLILMAAEISEIWDYVTGSKAELLYWQQVAERYLPGALTLVLPASDRVPSVMNPIDPTTIGVRVPNHAVARHILAQTRPLATTSINRSGQPPLETLEAIHREFPEVLTLTAEELNNLEQSLTEPQARSQSLQATNAGLPSTVVKWGGAGWEIVRQGGVRFEEI